VGDRQARHILFALIDGQLSRTEWIILPVGMARSTALRKQMNSRCRCCVIQRTRTAPLSHVEGGEQRGDAIALIIVFMVPHLPGLSGKLSWNVKLLIGSVD
jgi:hypothetical protein